MKCFSGFKAGVALSASILLAGTACSTAFAADADTIPAWLSDINGKQAMDWVKAENQRTIDRLGHGPLYQGLYDASMKLQQTHDRIAFPEQNDGQIYNFWRDETHHKGILRRTNSSSYDAGKPEWTTVLDLDALAAQEKRNWVWKGMDCLQKQQNICLINLSDGGEDALTVREFDLRTGKFVEGGFTLPHAKQIVAWLDQNTLLISYPWTPDQVTASSYPYIIKELKRGQKLSEAKTVFSGTKADFEVDPEVFHDGLGHQIAIIREGVEFFSFRTYAYQNGKVTELDLPRKSNISGLFNNKLVVFLSEDWNKGGQHFPAGSVVLVDPSSPQAVPQVVAIPGAKQVIEEATVSHGRLLVTLYDNVRGRISLYTPQGEGFAHQDLELPANMSVNVVSADVNEPVAYATSAGFLTPTTLWRIDTATGAVSKVSSLPAQFDATNMVVDQDHVRSKDGTVIPYFAVHRKDMKFNGTNPTLLYAYGGFEVPLFPHYSASIGKSWLERGGVYVLANIRGGGEFGPAWHEAGLKTHRQRIYDDFAAVGKDLFTKKITSPQHLAIQGGSNGGLLMGVEFTQHPDMWRAVDIEVPLLDMMNFEHMSAGASWVGEYGSVSIPEQKAFLRSISPVQNLKAGTRYPEPFIETTTKDDRVGPVHARRFAWRMSELKLPYYYWEQVAGGHGVGASQAEVAQTEALTYAYLWDKLGTSN
ncbi:prolyl oligopeptidase family serine peptidase [Gluconobacter wancherniae]|uniref:prolyl oligopeptidase family serine peptidase n=1 Tax=Gluconobacter wancherniae TaxID=1307955 RepID=UPI003095F2B7